MAKTKYRKKTIKTKVYFLKDPDGTEYRTENLNTFCKEHGLNQGNMSSVCSGRYSQHKGWTGKCVIEKKLLYIKRIKRTSPHLKQKTIAPVKDHKRIPVDEVIARMTEHHEGYYDYSLVPEDYTLMDKDVRVICRVEGHPIFHTTPNEHLLAKHRVKHCPLCIKQKLIVRPKAPPSKTTKPSTRNDPSYVRNDLRNYVFTSGGKITIGDSVERAILQRLEKKGYTRDDIIMWHDYDPISVIKWFPNRLDRTNYRLHYVNIFIKTNKTVIYPISSVDELKDSTLLKIRDQCLREGYRFEMWHVIKKTEIRIYI